MWCWIDLVKVDTERGLAIISKDAASPDVFTVGLKSLSHQLGIDLDAINSEGPRSFYVDWEALKQAGVREMPTMGQAEEIEALRKHLETQEARAERAAWMQSAPAKTDKPKTDDGVPVYKIARKGMMAVQLGDSSPFTFDVVKVNDEWVDREREFLNEKHRVRPELSAQWRMALYEFVCGVAGLEPSTADISFAECLEFIRVIGNKTEELSVFFAPKAASKDEPSSPESTALTFE